MVRGCVWQGVCMAGGRECAWLGGMHGLGACMAGGMHGGGCIAGGHAWQWDMLGRGACMAGVGHV